MRARDAVLVGTFVFTLTTAAVGPAPAAAQAAPASAPASSSTSAGGWTNRSTTASPQTVDVAGLPKVKSPGKPNATRLPLLVRDPAAYAAAKKNPKGKPGLAITKPATSRTAGPKTSIFSASFAGIDSNTESPIQTYTAEPPDTQIAVGATRIVEMVNSTGQVYTKAGAPIFTQPFTLHAFFLLDFWSATHFGGEPLNPTDPRVLYDLSTGRWYASVLAFNGPSYDSGVVLAISNTNDPAGAWTVYWMAGGSALICDQPKLGFSSDKFVIGCSLYGPSFNPAFQGALAIVGSKTQGLSRTTMKVTFFGPSTSAFGLVPAENMNSGISTAYVAFNKSILGTAATAVLKITGDPKLGTASLIETDLAMTATAVPPPAPQNMSTTSIDTGDDRFMSAFVQGGVLYTSGGDSCTPAGDTAVRSCLRLVEVNLTLMRMNQAATAGLVGKYLINPTLGVNSSGDVVFEYSVSSPTDFVDIETAIQPVGDPNTFVGGGQVVAGMAPYVGFTSSTQPNLRWGDYGAVVMDPSAPASVYVAGEWSNGGVTTPDWSTWIAELSGRIPSVCTATGLTSDHMSPSPPNTSMLVTGTATCVTGATADYSFWIKPPGGVLAMVQNYGNGPTFNWSGQVTLGTWTLEVRTRATTETRAYDSLMDLAYVITAAPCTTPTLTPSVGSPQVARTPVMLTATTVCGTTPLYQFWIKTPDLVWHMVRDYNPSNLYNWAALNTQVGSYLLEVLVKNTGSLGAYDSFTNIPYSLVLCTPPTLSTGAASSPYISGSGAITLTATGSCAGGTQFEFFYQDTANIWHVMGTGYGNSNTAIWKADFKAGSYHFQVSLRPAGSTAGYITYTRISFTLTGCGVPTLSPDLTSPQLAGTTVNWTATVTCTGTPQYSFYFKTPAGVWTLGQTWGPSATFPWHSPTATGTYTMDVQVRNAGADEDVYDNFLTAVYSLTACTAATLSTGAATTPYISGSGAITLTATGSCAGGTQFEFFYQDTSNIWHVIGSGYGSSNTAVWNADFKAGSYQFQVSLRPVGSTAGYITYARIPFTLTGCGAPTLIPQQTSPQPAGTQIQWNATVTCTGTPQFSFYFKTPAGAWILGQDWGPLATFTWSSPATKGTYIVDVQVRNQGAIEDVYDNFTTTPYTLS